MTRPNALNIGRLDDDSVFSLPISAVTQPMAILARRGAGKTYAALKLAEEMMGADLQVVILDPTGVCWGLRSSASGKGEGFQVPILGGPHGDVPLEETAGKVIADLVVDHPGTSFVLDLSAFESDAAQDRFAYDFAARLYRAKAEQRTPVHIIVDEAESFAPQSPMPNQRRMLGAFEALTKRGRSRGIGVTLVSQRAASLNKNVLNQTECLFILQTTGPQDRKAIDDWIEGKGSKERRAEVLSSLAGLQLGEAWVWSPAWLDLLERVTIAGRTTFDSSRTPEPGEVLAAPRLAAVDLDSLRDRIADTIEKAEANDPTALRRRISELEAKLRKATSAQAEPERIEVEVPVEVLVPAPVLTDADRKVLEMLVEQLRRTANATAETGPAIEQALARFDHKASAPAPRVASPPRARPAKARPAARPDPPTGDGGPLGGGAPRKILGALVRHPEGLSARRAAALTGVSQSKSTLRNAVSSLRTAGYVEGSSDLLIATSAGVEAYGPIDPLPTGDELVAYWRGQLGGAPLAIFDALLEAWPRIPDRDELAAMTGIDPTISTMRNGLSRLRTLGVLGRGLDLDEDLMAAVGR